MRRKTAAPSRAHYDRPVLIGSGLAAMLVVVTSLTVAALVITVSAVLPLVAR